MGPPNGFVAARPPLKWVVRTPLRDFFPTFPGGFKPLGKEEKKIETTKGGKNIAVQIRGKKSPQHSWERPLVLKAPSPPLGPFPVFSGKANKSFSQHQLLKNDL